MDDTVGTDFIASIVNGADAGDGPPSGNDGSAGVGRGNAAPPDAGVDDAGYVEVEIPGEPDPTDDDDDDDEETDDDDEESEDEDDESETPDTPESKAERELAELRAERAQQDADRALNERDQRFQGLINQARQKNNQEVANFDSETASRAGRMLDSDDKTRWILDRAQRSRNIALQLEQKLNVDIQDYQARETRAIAAYGFSKELQVHYNLTNDQWQELLDLPPEKMGARAEKIAKQSRVLSNTKKQLDQLQRQLGAGQLAGSGIGTGASRGGNAVRVKAGSDDHLGAIFARAGRQF